MAKRTGSEPPRPQADEKPDKKRRNRAEREELEKNRDSDRRGTAGEREVDPWA